MEAADTPASVGVFIHARHKRCEALLLQRQFTVIHSLSSTFCGHYNCKGFVFVISSCNAESWTWFILEQSTQHEMRRRSHRFYLRVETCAWLRLRRRLALTSGQRHYRPAPHVTLALCRLTVILHVRHAGTACAGCLSCLFHNIFSSKVFTFLNRKRSVEMCALTGT